MHISMKENTMWKIEIHQKGQTSLELDKKSYRVSIHQQCERKLWKDVCCGRRTFHYFSPLWPCYCPSCLWSSVLLSLCIINPPTLRNRQKLQKLSESWWNPWHRPWWTYFKRQFDFEVNVNVNYFLFCWAWPYGMRRCPGDSSHCLRLPSQCRQRT